MDWARAQARSALKLPSEHFTRDILLPDESRVDIGLGTWADPNLMPHLMTWDSGLTESLLGYNSSLPSSMLGDNEALPENKQSDELTSLFDLLPASTQQASEHQLDPLCHEMWPAFEDPQTCSSLQPSTSSKGLQQWSDSAWMSVNQQASHSSLSPFSIDYQLTTTTNSHLTSQNLLQIYHDVLEHNLSCWLTEITCPYQLRSLNTCQTVPDWGSSWSNRIYQRTIKLDCGAQACNLLQLTRAEDQAASKALHLAIMAFATQWAQGSQRHRQKYPTRPLDHSSIITDEFDRILQHQFWDQAERALQDVAGLESFRVVCAELIFGLTQKPWSRDDSMYNKMEAKSRTFAIDSVLYQVRHIIHKDGPPINMERAVRKMHTLKYRCEMLERRLRKQDTAAPSIKAMDSEDRATIGLLYWLAIMFDTVSSSMSERPVVVLDEDCQHEAQEVPKMDKYPLAQSSSRWNLDLFVQGSLQETTHRTHWPCSYETAAKDVIKSAPVKVLLFRHVSYLQNAIRKSASSHAEQIEDIIRSTMSLYEYWNKTHGAFFAELVQNYTAIPHRIQGWFVCISAHWHLAALMFADLLEFVDENTLGTQDGGASRIHSQIARKIKKHSASELSDLAKVATPPPKEDNNLGEPPQLPSFHEAVNEGSLLTEPWTMIPIRAFTKACVIFLREADASLRFSRTTASPNDQDLERNMEQAKHCIKGLWLLGKKSDMARKTAEALSRALGELRNECVV